MTKRQDEKDEKDAQEQQRRESQHRVDDARRQAQAQQQAAGVSHHVTTGVTGTARAAMRPAPTHQDLPPRPPPPPAPPEVYTLIDCVSGHILGAFTAEGGAEWIDIGNSELRRVARIDTAAAERVPVVYVSEANAAALRDPKVAPPDFFSGMAGAHLAGVATMLAWYHSKGLHDIGKVSPIIHGEHDAA